MVNALFSLYRISKRIVTARKSGLRTKEPQIPLQSGACGSFRQSMQRFQEL